MRSFVVPNIFVLIFENNIFDIYSEKTNKYWKCLLDERTFPNFGSFAIHDIQPLRWSMLDIVDLMPCCVQREGCVDNRR